MTNIKKLLGTVNKLKGKIERGLTVGQFDDYNLGMLEAYENVLKESQEKGKDTIEGAYLFDDLMVIRDNIAEENAKVINLLNYVKDI